MALNVDSEAPAPLVIKDEPEKTVNQVPRHWFLISGAVEYVQLPGDEPKSYKVNCIYAGESDHLRVRDLAKIQTTLQMHFHTKYSRRHPQPPDEITDAVIYSIGYLGFFTDEEFYAGAPTGENS